MAFPTPGHRYTYQQYLAVDRDAKLKHEYSPGEIYALAGGTPEHAALASAINGILYAQLRGRPCRVYSADLRVRVLATGLATYPDLTVICGAIERDPESAEPAVNPRAVVEVLNPSTQDYDRGDKLEHYQRIPSLALVLLVSQAKPEVEVWQRDGEAWTSRSYAGGDTIDLAPIGCTLSVDEVYAVLRAP